MYTVDVLQEDDESEESDNPAPAPVMSEEEVAAMQEVSIVMSASHEALL